MVALSLDFETFMMEVLVLKVKIGGSSRQNHKPGAIY